MNRIITAVGSSLRFMRMAPDDGNGGGGGEQPPPPAEGQQPAQPQQPTVDQRMDQMMQRMEQTQQLVAGLAQRITQPQQQPQQEQNEDPRWNQDPELIALKRQQQQIAAQQMRLMEQQDIQNFIGEVQAKGLTDEEAKQAIGVYQQWVHNKMTFGGQPPSRVDALRYWLGVSYDPTKPRQAQVQNQQEQTRRAQNANAFVETGSGAGGTGYRATYADDFNQKTLVEQAKVIGPNLDKAFPNGW